MKYVVRLVGLLLFSSVLSVGYMLCIFVPMEASPATKSDPLVTLSYIDKRLSDINEYIDSRLEKIENHIGNISTNADNKTKISTTNTSNNSSSTLDTTDTTANTTFNIVKIPINEMIYLDDSAEVIIRSGKAVVIGSKSGGLIDISAGSDLRDGMIVPNNHLILNPMNDGRGIAFVDESWVMIRGKYTIISN